MRVVFMGTPEFAVPALDAVARAHSIVSVYTQPDKPVGRGLDLRASPVKKRALELGLDVRQPERLNTADEFARLAALAPDAIAVVAYGKILRKNVLELPRLGCINIHSSLLPRWRGAAPIQWAILAGDAESGVSTMHLVEELDAGDVLMTARTPISRDDTAGSLHDRLALLGAGLVVPTLDGLAAGTLKGVRQDPAGVTYAEKLSREMEWLDPAAGAAALERRVRALNPWPGTSVWLEVEPGKPPQRLKVKAARPLPGLGAGGARAGEVFEQAGMLLYGAKDGAIQLLGVQWDGKKEVDAAGFLNGLKGRGTALPLRGVKPV